ncbi:MAG: hypothetical protein FWC78_06640, partial [Defluviitaleaceae bacterium]|nr:hypothetical protein [Defluviitaleaceae bacterium]
FFARRGAENRRALAVRKVFSDEGLWEIYKLYVRVFRWSGYKLNCFLCGYIDKHTRMLPV